MLDISPNLAAGDGVSAHCAETLRTLCGDSDPCAVVELNNLEPAFFPHPCAETPTHAETPTRAETRILTVLSICYKVMLDGGSMVAQRREKTSPGSLRLVHKHLFVDIM